MTTSYKWTLPDNWPELIQQSEQWGKEWTMWRNDPDRSADYVFSTESPEFEETYQGWACTHSSHPPEHNHTGKSLEELIIEINDLGASVKIAVDQWWGIRAEGSIENWKDEGDPNWIELNFNTYIQADELHDGLEKTYDVWKSRWEFHKGRGWQ
jgi:hypothetical protein